MKFPADTPVSAAKLTELKERLARLKVDLSLVEEQAVKSGGPGGQHRNKSACAVVLRCRQHGVTVRSQKERSRALNRFFALRALAEAVEIKSVARQRADGETTDAPPVLTAREKKAARLRKQKQRRLRRRRPSEPPEESRP